MEEGTRFSLCDDCFAYSVSGVSSEAVLRGSAFAARRALSSAEYGRWFLPAMCFAIGFILSVKRVVYFLKKKSRAETDRCGFSISMSIILA